MSDDITGTVCPHCGYEFDVAVGVGHGAPPSSGDISVCVNCGGIGIFTVSDDEVLGMRKPTREELTDAYRDLPWLFGAQADTRQALHDALEVEKK